jgi:hypothetical protein
MEPSFGKMLYMYIINFVQRHVVSPAVPIGFFLPCGFVGDPTKLLRICPKIETAVLIL